MGHIVHMRHQFKSKNTYDYIITSIREKPVISFLRIEWLFFWTTLNSLHPRRLYARYGWNWFSGSEEDFKMSSMYFAISLLRSPSLAQTWIPFTEGCFVPSSVEIGTLVLEKKIKIWKVYGQTPLYDVLSFVINIENVCTGFTFYLLILILKMYVCYKFWKF